MWFNQTIILMFFLYFAGDQFYIFEILSDSYVIPILLFFPFLLFKGDLYFICFHN
jgi:hypothetical protein